MLPFAYPAGLPPTAVAGATLTMPANGGTLIVPFILPDLLCAQSMNVQTQDPSQAHSVEFGFYDDRGDLPLNGVIQSFAYTGSGNAVRRGNLSQPIYMGPGVVWLVLRNTGGTTVQLGAVAPGTLGGNHAGTAVIAAPLATGLSGVTWSPIANMPLIRVNGSLGGVLPGAEL